eukprot:177469-Pelagomonas_calceolata.AAC.1
MPGSSRSGQHVIPIWDTFRGCNEPSFLSVTQVVRLLNVRLLICSVADMSLQRCACLYAKFPTCRHCGCAAPSEAEL